MDVASAFAAFFGHIWSIFALNVPGFNVSFQQLFLGAFVAVAAVSAFKSLIGAAGGGSSYRSGRSARKGSGGVDDDL